MAGDNVESIQELMDSAQVCTAGCRRFVSSFRRGYRAIKRNGEWSDRRRYDQLSADLNRQAGTLRESANRASAEAVEIGTIVAVEDANLNFLRPVRFREADFLTATEAVSHVALQLLEDCESVIDWGNCTELTDGDRLEDCKRLLRTWRSLTDEVFRDWLIQIEVECRRAILSEYEWMDRQGKEPPERRYAEKVSARRRRLEQLRKDNKIDPSDYAGLLKIAKDDPEIIAIGLRELTLYTVQNDMRKPRRH